MKNLKLTKVTTTFLIVISALTLNPVGASAQWKQNSTGWWNTEGSSWSVGWKQIDGKWYYFGQDGYMAHDVTINGYTLGSDGTWIETTENVSSNTDKKIPNIDNKTFSFDQFVKILKTKVANLEIEDGDNDFLPTTRKIITFGDEQLDVYIYLSNKEMENDSLNIHSNGSIYSSTKANGDKASTKVNWISSPHFYKKGRIIVQYIGKNEKIISDLNDILGEQFAGDKEYSNLTPKEDANASKEQTNSSNTKELIPNSYEKLDKLPQKYNSDVAQKNGDVVQILGNIKYNANKLKKFNENYKNKKANIGDMVRITSYGDEGGVTIRDLIINSDGSIKLIEDNTRDYYSSEKDRIITEYRVVDIYISDTTGYITYYVKTDQGEEIFLGTSNATWIQSTQNSYEELDKLPQVYSDMKAKENGDIEVTLGDIDYNIKKLDKFIENYKNGKSNIGDMIRITSYGEAGNVTIRDLIINTEGIKLIEDNSRNPFCSKTAKEYKVIDMYKTDKTGYMTYYLKCDQGEEKFIGISNGLWINSTRNSYASLDKLPQEYHAKQAEKNGDVIKISDTDCNIDKLDKFIKNYKNKTSNLGDQVRITNYTDKGEPVISDLIIDSEGLKLIEDATRDNFISKENRIITKYKVVALYKTIKTGCILYYAKTDQENEKVLYSSAIH